MPFQIYKAQIDPSLSSDLEVSYIGLVGRPAIEKNFQAFKELRARFTLDEERQIISGPAMVADMPLYRKDEALGEYYVVFDAPSIFTIVQKFAAKGNMTKFNLFHDDQQQVQDVTIFNSFITDKQLGINAPVGFEDLAEGSWFISAKVNNPAVWAKVKSGEIKGFSVEGIFSYMPARMQKLTVEQAMERIKEILFETNITD